MKYLNAALLTGVFTVLVAGVIWLTMHLMYNTAKEQQTEQLQEEVLILSRLIEAPARSTDGTTPKEARTEALDQLKIFFADITQQVLHNECVIAERQDADIVFLMSGRPELPRPVAFEGSTLAEPMRRALSGETGTVVAEDYDGTKVLAAYTPIESLHLGLVEKVSMARLRAPYIRSGLAVFAGAALVIVIGAGSIHRVAGSVNRTLRKQARELEENQQRLRSFEESAVDGIITIAPGGIVQTFNPAAERIFGYPANEVIGQNVKMLMPAPYRDEHDDYLQHYLATGEKKIIGSGREVSGRRKDGSVFPLDLAVSEAITEQGRLFTGTVRDISERKAVEEEIRELTERLKLATESAGIGVWDYHIPSQALMWDARMYELYDVREGEFSRTYDAWTTRLHPDDRDRARIDLETALAGSGEFHSQFRIRRSDGRVRHIQAHASTSYAADGSPERMIGVNWDITQQVEIADKMERLNELLTEQKNTLARERDRAQKADRVKSAFLATMSHELRTPLNSIIGFTDVVLKKIPGPLNPEQEKQLNMVYRSARHLLELINDVLDISKIEAGEMKTACEPFDLFESLERVAAGVEPLARKKGLALTFEADPALGIITSDRRRVEQIVINLLNNAVKFTEKGGVRLEGTRQVDSVLIRVIDTGSGIRPEDRETLFKPFQQVDTGLNRQKEGTGLGLSICIRLAQLLGGSIDLESEWQQGSTFSLHLPIAKEPPHEENPDHRG